MPATQPSVPASSASFVTLSREDLNLLLKQAAAHGAAQVLALQQSEYLGMAQAAAYVYGRSDRVPAFRALRRRYPEIDTLSVGAGRFRKWRKSDLDSFLSSKQIRRQTETVA